MAKKCAPVELPDYLEQRQSKIHGGGLFATKKIKKGTAIIEYVGEKVSKAESYRRAESQMERAQDDGSGLVYMFELNKKTDIDGNVPWNPARLINHSCKPNAEPQVIKGRIWIIAIRSISAGDEIYYNYGYDVDHFEEHPCRCGAKRCVGYIVREDHWPKLKKALKKKRAEEKKRLKSRK